MKSVFLDLGAWRGTATQFIIDNYPDSDKMEYFLLEPDQKVCNKYLQKVIDNNPKHNITVMNAAIWVTGGHSSFYIGKHGRGSSLFKDKLTGKINTSEPVQVYTVSIGELMKQLVGNGYDNIICKMNIEGSEYPVLQHMMNVDILQFVSKLYVSWHWSKIGVKKEVHDKLVADIKASGVKLYPWNLTEDKNGNTSFETNKEWFAQSIGA